MTALETRLYVTAIACALANVALGFIVSQRTPFGIDTAGRVLRNHAVPVASFFTALGRGIPLAVLAVAALAAALLLRTGVRATIVLLVAQMLSQAVNTGEKLLFARPRPEWNVVEPERDLSYPSGHSITAVVFFAGFAMLVRRAPLPGAVTTSLSALLTVCAAAIPWSRLALGAHFVTDVAGGLLAGTAWLCLAGALLLRFAGTSVP